MVSESWSAALVGKSTPGDSRSCVSWCFWVSVLERALSSEPFRKVGGILEFG